MKIPGAAALLTTAVLGVGCSVHTEESHRVVVRLVTDATLSEALVAEYARLLPNVEVQLVAGIGSPGAVGAIQRGEADLGFSLGDVAYFTYLRRSQQQSADLKELRGIAALHVAPIHLLARNGLTIRTVTDLRGFRIGVGTAFAAQTLLADLVFRAYGLGPEVVQPGPRADLLSDVDGAFATAYYPAPSVHAAMRQGAQLVSIDGPIADGLRHEYPFVRSVMIPARTYPGQDRPVRTIGVDRLFICRSDLDERLVHDLTQRFFEALPNLSAPIQTSLRLMDLEQASATPIPLHRGAAQYYRERELSK